MVEVGLAAAAAVVVRLDVGFAFVVEWDCVWLAIGTIVGTE